MSEGLERFVDAQGPVYEEVQVPVLWLLSTRDPHLKVLPFGAGVEV